MKISVNGEEEMISQEISLVEFLEGKDLDLDRLVIEYNYEVVQRENWDNITLKDEDNLEILRFVGGG